MLHRLHIKKYLEEHPSIVTDVSEALQQVEDRVDKYGLMKSKDLSTILGNPHHVKKLHELVKHDLDYRELQVQISRDWSGE